MSETAVVARATTARPELGVTAILLASVLFAMNGTVAKLMLKTGMSESRLTQLRAIGAFGVILAIVVVTGRVKNLKVAWREVPQLIVFGALGFVLVPTLFFMAIKRLPVGIGLLLEYTAPVLVALWARFGQRQMVRSRLWWGLILSLAGLGLVAEIWGDLRLDGLGIAAAIASAFGLAAYYVIGARAVARHDTVSITCWGWGVGAVISTIIQPLGFPIHLLADTSQGMPMWLLAGYVIVLGSVAPYLLTISALGNLPATSVGIVAMAEPVLAGGIAWVLLGETLSAAQLVGSAVVVAGVILAETARANPDPPPGLL